MRFGLVILPEARWAAAAPRWRAVEDMGWDHAWTYDHLVWAGLPEAPWFGAIPTLTAAAGVTHRIGLGTLVASPNFRHPVPFVSDVLALDDIAAGRTLLGVGVGGDLDSAMLGEQLTVPDRVDRFVEWTMLVGRLLTEDHVDHTGDYYRAADARTLPGPYAGAGVPLLVAANGPRTIRLAAQVGTGWITNGPRGETLEQWWDGVRVASTRMDQAQRSAGGAGRPFARILSLDTGPFFALRSVGFFEDCVGRASELGFTDVVTHWPRPDGPYAGDRATMEQVSAEVLPRWQGGTPSTKSAG
ncbi:MAG: LLM class flavin-dependent oxidoreductase [Nostocoides sp.]